MVFYNRPSIAHPFYASKRHDAVSHRQRADLPEGVFRVMLKQVDKMWDAYPSDVAYLFHCTTTDIKYLYLKPGSDILVAETHGGNFIVYDPEGAKPIVKTTRDVAIDMLVTLSSQELSQEDEHSITPMSLAVAVAAKTMSEDVGGPFGAAIVAPDGYVVCVTSNTVLRDKDPTAHAEMNAIREACKILNTHDLSGYTLYATGYPCPMCLSAIIWANIKTVYYGCTPKDAEEIGFRDDYIYRFIQNDCVATGVLNLVGQDRDMCKKYLFDVYADMEKEVY